EEIRSREEILQAREDSLCRLADIFIGRVNKSLENFITLQLSLTTISPYPAGTQIDVYKPCIKQMQTVLGPVNTSPIGLSVIRRITRCKKNWRDNITRSKLHHTSRILHNQYTV
ncbi:MAG: hypothetical protein N0E42_01870, partial [Candidatus Thiodiazotropha endolucinida]|nr:hypothetical protein [Candidatus Thiodiazotropha taylori]MCW4223228.1 hypothetical protein [Candidatus Thiodiazotropha endolucinida]